MPAIWADQRPWVFDPWPDINVDLYSPTKLDIFSPGHQKGLHKNTIPVPSNSEVGASQVAGSWRQITSMIYPLKHLKVTRPSLSFPQILPRIRQFFQSFSLGYPTEIGTQLAGNWDEHLINVISWSSIIHLLRLMDYIAYIPILLGYLPILKHAGMPFCCHPVW